MWHWPPWCGRQWMAALGPVSCGCGWTPVRGWTAPDAAWLQPSAAGRHYRRSVRFLGCGCLLCPPGRPAGTDCHSLNSCLRTQRSEICDQFNIQPVISEVNLNVQANTFNTLLTDNFNNGTSCKATRITFMWFCLLRSRAISMYGSMYKDWGSPGSGWMDTAAVWGRYFSTLNLGYGRCPANRGITSMCTMWVAPAANVSDTNPELFPHTAQLLLLSVTVETHRNTQQLEPDFVPPFTTRIMTLNTKIKGNKGMIPIIPIHSTFIANFTFFP